MVSTLSCPKPFWFGFALLLVLSWLAFPKSALYGQDRWVGGVKTPGSAYDVSTQGSYIFVADGGSGLQVIRPVAADASDSVFFQIVGGVETPGSADAVAVEGNYAYLAEDGPPYYGLQVVDVSDPAHPRIAGGFQLETFEASFDVALQGDYAYLVTFWYPGPPGGEAYLRVFDISDPTSPRLAGTEHLFREGSCVAVEGNYAYVGTCDVFNGGVVVYDISDPSDPRGIGSVDLPFRSGAEDIAVSGSYAYVADQLALEVIDVSNPSEPLIVGSVEAPGADCVAVRGSFAYVGNSSGLQLIDISNPYSPYIVESVPTLDRPEAVTVTGSYACITGRIAYGLNGVQVIDISNTTTGIETPGRDMND